MLNEMLRLLPLQQHHDHRGWLSEAWRLDRLPELQDTEMRLLHLEAGERSGLHQWEHREVSLTLCSGEATLHLGRTPEGLQRVPLTAPQTLVLSAGAVWGLSAESASQFLCALPGNAHRRINWLDAT